MPKVESTTKKKRAGKRPQCIGAIEGVRVGSLWESRAELLRSGVHRHMLAGIHGRVKGGAESVVMNGQYDDEDHGETFTYIGCGGGERGVRFGPQVRDQSWEESWHNRALRTSAENETPVRVIRGSELQSRYAPYAPDKETRFRYDGLYAVSNPRLVSTNTFKVCKFDFTRCPGQDPLPLHRPAPILLELLPTDIEVRRAKWKEAKATEEGPDVPPRNAPTDGVRGHTEDVHRATSPLPSVSDGVIQLPLAPSSDTVLGPAPSSLLAHVETHLNHFANSTSFDQQHRADLIILIGRAVSRVVRERTWRLHTTSPVSVPSPSPVPDSAAVVDLTTSSAAPGPSASSEQVLLPAPHDHTTPTGADSADHSFYTPQHAHINPGDPQDDEHVRWTRNLWGYVATRLPEDLSGMDDVALEEWYRREEIDPAGAASSSSR